MRRDKSFDKIFLNNFFKDRLAVFTGEQPEEETYLTFYDFATSDWYPLKKQIDTYPISKHLRDDLILLFDMAHDHHFYVGDIGIDSKRKMRELWYKIQRLAVKTDLPGFSEES